MNVFRNKLCKKIGFYRTEQNVFAGCLEHFYSKLFIPSSHPSQRSIRTLVLIFFMLLSMPVMANTIYSADMDSDPGWVLDPAVQSTRWEWGIPLGGGGYLGYPDPTAGFTGSNVMGYCLAGAYDNHITQTEWATTPAIDCSGHFNVKLSFYRWLNVESPSYDHAYIEISNDQNNWIRIWENTSAIKDQNWLFELFDISSTADDQSTVFIRWGMGSTDSSYRFSGWNIDDVVVFSRPPGVIYVDINASGINDGSSWANAHNDLQDALVNVYSDDRIWVAAGTYKPSVKVGGNSNRHKTFQMKNGVAIYGGFNGTETLLSQRDIENNQTILSGDLGAQGNPNDNCYHVFYHPEGFELDSNAVLDGFTITGGNADDDSYPDNSGGGMHNDNCSPTVKNCKFSGNSGYYGGGIMNYTVNAALTNNTFVNNSAVNGGGVYNVENGSLTLTDCSFSSNDADVGAGMLNYAADATLINCTFSDNSAEWGGGICNYDNGTITLTDCTFNDNDADKGGGALNYASEAILTNCTFSSNSAVVSGGGISNYKNSIATVADSTFSDNSAKWGGAIYNDGGNQVISNCDLANNSAEWAGGGIENYYSTTTVTDCTFSNNSSVEYGGGMNNEYSISTVTGCVFNYNSSNWGGGMHNENCNPEITDCTFSYNISVDYGGGMNNLESSPTVTNCIFNNNNSDRGGGMNNIYNCSTHVSNCSFIDNFASNGGGMSNVWSDTLIEFCSFSSNSSNDGGGGISNNDSNPTIVSCTFSKNSADWNGGAVENDGGSQTLTNCIFTGNSALGGGGMCNKSSSSQTLTNCTFINNSAIDVGGGVYSDNSGISLFGCIFNKNIQKALHVINSNFRAPLDNVYSAIAAGQSHSLALKADSSITAWGNNSFGQINLPEGDLYLAVEAGNAHSIALKTDGSIIGWGTDDYGQASPPAGNDYIAISAGSFHNLALKAEGTIVGWGIDKYGQASPPTGNDYEDIAAGYLHSLALKADGSIAGWGSDNFGQSSPPAGNDYVAIAAGTEYSLALKADGSIVGWGFDHYGQTSPPAGNDYIAIAAGVDHCLALKADGCIVGWGNNSLGQATPPPGDDYIAIAAYEHNLALKADGSIVSWPKNRVTLADCTITDNTTAGIDIGNCIVQMDGIVRLEQNELWGYDIDIIGDGTINTDPNTILYLDESSISCNISGTGTIQVNLETDLVIEGDAIIDMSDGETSGTIQCDGLLQVKDNVRLINTNVIVSRASFEGDVDISNSIIIAEAGSPYGQFFIEDSVTIADNYIHADGDRYMDLDPNSFAGLIENNFIYVTITEGVGNTRGGLFELRGLDDLAGSTCDSTEFFCKSPEGIPDFDTNTWTIEQLTIAEDAKVNLTNRFDFNNGDMDEVLYVKELIMEPNSVLNTAFNRIYYDNENIDPTAEVKNVPLLGFSLTNIALNNANEFMIRVAHNNLIHPATPSYDRIHVQRVEGLEPDPAGMMKMRVLKDLDPGSPTYQQMVNASAKGTFSKASEDQITITFEYMFVDDPSNDAELIVYLSDRRQLGQGLLEVARIRPPSADRDGSTESNEFATFFGTFSGEGLNFIRGTYVELELTGTDASCLIDNWDPQIYCITCGDYNQSGWVLADDYLVLLAEYGLSNPADSKKGCLDLTGDGVVNIGDLLSWDAQVALNLCGTGYQSTASADMTLNKQPAETMSFNTPVISDTAPLVIAGKSNIAGEQSIFLYDVDTNGNCLSDAQLPACPDGDCAPVNGRLVKDSNDEIYQINANYGLVHQITGVPVVPPKGNIPFMDSLVKVGINSNNGLPLLDVVFSPINPDIVYVVPVLITPAGGGCTYKAAAKLALTGGLSTPDYSVIMLYGNDPNMDPGVTITGSECGSLILEPDVQQSQEIEIDEFGNLFVLSSQNKGDNDWIIVYDELAGTASEQRVLISDLLEGPVSMHVSDYSNNLYLASSVDFPADANKVDIYKFDIQRSGNQVTGLNYSGNIEVSNPVPQEAGFGFFNTITSIDENPATGTLYAAGFTSLRYEDDYINANPLPIPATPTLAVIPFETSEPIYANKIAGSNMALPLSLIWTGSGEPEETCGADITGEGDVNMLDFAKLSYYWLNPICEGSDSCNGANLDGANGVNFDDLSIMARFWLYNSCN